MASVVRPEPEVHKVACRRPGPSALAAGPLAGPELTSRPAARPPLRSCDGWAARWPLSLADSHLRAQDDGWGIAIEPGNERAWPPLDSLQEHVERRSGERLGVDESVGELLEDLPVQLDDLLGGVLRVVSQPACLAVDEFMCRGGDLGRVRQF